MSFAVTGMTCAACASRVQRVLERAEGVTDALRSGSDDAAAEAYDEVLDLMYRYAK